MVRRPVNAPSDARDPSPKFSVTVRTAGAPSGGRTSTVNVTGCPTTGSVGLAVTVTGMPGAGRTCTATDDAWRRSAASSTSTVAT